ENLYPPLAAIANRWAQQLGERRFPETLDGLLDQCARLGQHKPTPLVLRYGPGGYNCLHQDIYGELTFPLQFLVMLSKPDEDFTGGESVFVEQRPRQQSRPMVARPFQGQAVIFPVRHRPKQGARGYHRLQMRHGVSAVHTGDRHVLGIIFHNAR
ncbi:MAG: proline hydroxylase, partial [Pseudonocardiales bacterium]